ncbi:MAG: mechanosensitive ion channel [Candidatus Moranbacteria bacterium]|nr:mechanosensitive ion channel [Candidatus Moranbacteria bacterium]
MLNNLIPSEILQKIFFGSSVEQYMTALIYFIIAVIALGILQKVILKKLDILSKKTKNDIDDVIIEIVRGIKPKFYIVLSIYISLQVLSLSEMAVKIISAIFIFIVIFQITSSLQLLINFLAQKFSGNNEESGEHTKSAAHLLGTIVTFFIWVIGILMILSNVGVNVSSLLAGIGIGGLAIAFALKEILADLFASFSIYFDKPFKAGDVIAIGNDKGKVKKIGIKTTRVLVSTGEEIIISNQDLTSARVYNFRKLERRRVSFLIKVVRSTSLEKLKMINDLVEEIVNNIENIEFSRCHFKMIDEWSHTFEMIYYVNSRSHSEYLEAHQEFNFTLCEKLREAKIELAYPTQTKLEIETTVN